MDPVEHILTELDKKCSHAWKGKGSECSACPVGEVAALVAAALEFYRQEKGLTSSPRLAYDPDNARHWSDDWRKSR